MTFTTEERMLCEAFNARLETETDGCAHALFPEVTGSEAAMSLIDQTMETIVENYNQAGRSWWPVLLSTRRPLFSRVAETIDHALVIAVAFGYALGAAPLPTRSPSTSRTTSPRSSTPTRSRVRRLPDLRANRASASGSDPDRSGSLALPSQPHTHKTGTRTMTTDTTTTTGLRLVRLSDAYLTAPRGAEPHRGMRDNYNPDNPDTAVYYAGPSEYGADWVCIVIPESDPRHAGAWLLLPGQHGLPEDAVGTFYGWHVQTEFEYVDQEPVAPGALRGRPRAPDGHAHPERARRLESPSGIGSLATDARLRPGG
jgi:hypothetical protein